MTGSTLEACSDCIACDLAKTRQSVVISRGNPDAQVMLIGEAPGAQEDSQGIPFVGRSGRALDQLLRDVDRKSAALRDLSAAVQLVTTDTERVEADPGKGSFWGLFRS